MLYPTHAVSILEVNLLSISVHKQIPAGGLTSKKIVFYGFKNKKGTGVDS